jgi:hypothetical protein
MSTLRRALPVAVLVLALTAATAAAIPATARVSTAGLGKLEIGLTAAQVRAAGSAPFTLSQAAEGSTCQTGTLGKGVHGLFTSGRLVRIDVTSTRYATKSGVRVGDSQAKLLATYPSLVGTPDKYDDDVSHFTLTFGSRKMVLEAKAGKVVSIATGRTPEIGYVEGCS